MFDAFQQPAWLWLLALLIPLAGWDLKRRWKATPIRRLLSVAIRVLMFAALIVALAQPTSREEETHEPIVFLIDRSNSISDDALTKAIEQVETLRKNLPHPEDAGLIFFGGTPEIIARPGAPWEIPANPRHTPPHPNNKSTDIAAALELGMGLIPPQLPGQLLLLTDGVPTRGTLAESLTEAQARNIRIHTQPLKRSTPEATIAEVRLANAHVRPGETLQGHLIIKGKAGAKGSITLKFAGDEKTQNLQVTLGQDPAGIRVPFEQSLPKGTAPGPTTLELTYQEDGHPEKKQTLFSDVMVSDPPHILIIEQSLSRREEKKKSQDVEHLVKVLKAEGMQPKKTKTAELAKLTPPELEKLFRDHELIILANVAVKIPGTPTPTLTEDFLQHLRRYVSAGGGLIVIGGDRTYELGGYAKSPIANILPLKVDPLDVEVEPAVTMIIILDRSGSMGAAAGNGRTKMELANQGAIASMKLLRSFDIIGVTAVDDAVHWIVELQPVIERESIERAITGIEVGGGGIYVYTSLIDARDTLQDASTPLRHIILFSDARDSEEQVKDIPFGWGAGHNCYDLAKEMAEDGITTSVIGIGTEFDSDTAFLKRVAEEGGGKFYITEDANKLSALFVEETQRLIKTRLHEKPFNVTLSTPHTIANGIDWNSAPKLRGHIETESRETAEVILRGPDEHPIVTAWQYGLGNVVALSTDAGTRWARDWLLWDGYTRFWTQTVRWTLQREEGRTTSVQVNFNGDEALIQVARRTRDGFTRDQSGLHAQLIELGPDGEQRTTHPISLKATEPGLWESKAHLNPRSTYRVEILDSQGELVTEESFIAPPSAEMKPRAIDQAQLQNIANHTGGRFNTHIDTLPRLESNSSHPIDLWFYAAFFGFLLMPLDAFLRRPGREV